MDMNNCGASEKHTESKNEITELQKLIKDLQKKEAKASEELQSFKLAKERSVNSFFCGYASPTEAAKRRPLCRQVFVRQGLDTL